MNPDDDLGIDVLAMPMGMRAKIADSRAALKAAMPLPPPVPHAPPEMVARMIDFALHIDRLAVHSAAADPRGHGEIVPMRVGRSAWRTVGSLLLFGATMSIGILGMLVFVELLFRVGLPAALKMLGGW
jgi:hypothetical protein